MTFEDDAKKFFCARPERWSWESYQRESRPMCSMELPDNQLSPSEVEAELRAFSSGPDWKRAESLARMCAAGLGDWTPDDLLAEALVKLLGGERTWRRGVSPLVTLKTIMRSISRASLPATKTLKTFLPLGLSGCAGKKRPKNWVLK